MGATSGAVDKNKFGRELEAVIRKITTMQPEVVYIAPFSHFSLISLLFCFFRLLSYPPLFIHIKSFQNIESPPCFLYPSLYDTGNNSNERKR